jgi:nucleotide-binding universal stress UspA family protein
VTASQIKKILAPTDFSDCGRAAVDHAIDLARALGAEVHLLHVCPLLMYAIGPDVVPDDPDFERKLKAGLQEKLHALAEELGDRGVPIHTLMVDGNPAHEVAEVAAREGFDLVVMSTHGRSGLAHLTLGSVAERTVRHSHVPVLTVRAPEE